MTVLTTDDFIKQFSDIVRKTIADERSRAKPPKIKRKAAIALAVAETWARATAEEREACAEAIKRATVACPDLSTLVGAKRMMDAALAAINARSGEPS